jgi:hypothetical protein
MANGYAVSSIVVAVLGIVIAAVYFSGAADPYIEKAAEFIFKKEAQAQAQAFAMQGKKEGVDFLEGMHHLLSLFALLWTRG